jgi:hypothetical protein
LLGRIAAALGAAVALRARVARLRGRGLATALARFASAAGAGAAIVHFVIHCNTPLIGRLVGFRGHQLSVECIVSAHSRPGLKKQAEFLEQIS